MTTFTKQTDIQSPLGTVWNIMQNVEEWHHWTPTITSIAKLGQEPLSIGTKLLIEQPNLPKATWQVTEVIKGVGFSMAKGNSFVKVVAVHLLEPIPTGTRVILSLQFSGLFGSWIAKKYRVMMEDYLTAEAAGLKQESEKRQSSRISA